MAHESEMLQKQEKKTPQSLEEIVHICNTIGMQYVEARRQAERLELLKPTIKSKIICRHDNGEISETKLRRIAETDAEYLQFIEDLSKARMESEKLRIRYESYKNLFEARRSLLSYQKAEMKLM